MIFESIKMAFFSLKSNKIRSILTMIGITVGVAAVITIVSMGSGVQELILGEFEQLGASSSTISLNFNKATDSDRINQEDISALRLQIQNLKYISRPVYAIGNYEAKHEDHLIFLMGVDSDFLKMYSPELVAGRFFTPVEYEDGLPSIIIDPIVANRFFGSAERAIGQEVETQVDHQILKGKIVGVINYPGGDLMNSMMTSGGMMTDEIPLFFYTTAKTIQHYFPNNNSAMGIMLMAKSPNFIDQVNTQAIKLIEFRHDNAGLGIYNSRNMADMLQQIEKIMNIVTIVISVIAAISLVVGGIGVMNIMLVSVTERYREIGIRKAIGATMNDILIQFLTEAIFLTTFGGFCGLVAGVLLSRMVSAILNFRVVLSLRWIAIAIIFSTLTGLIFGIAPARKAAKLSPIDALRYE
ncbi:MAG: FtsX-like permease family protein [Clostridiaceae bacterium]|nr:FtsX-like permease family protein [Clostridiaceae bacterium]